MVDTATTTFLKDREKLISIACSIVQDQSIAEEIVQESWLRYDARGYHAAEARPIFRRIVANLARDWRRSRKAEFFALTELYARRTHTPSAEAIVVARSELALVIRTLRKLPSRNVLAFRLRALENKSYKCIGRRLNLSISHTHALVEQVIVELGLALDG